MTAQVLYGEERRQEKMVINGLAGKLIASSGSTEAPKKELKLHPYDREYYEGKAYKPPYYRNFITNYTTFQKMMELKPESLLELGGGRGYITKMASHKGIPSTCMDISEYCYHTRACNSFILWNAEDTPWRNDPSVREDHYFDLIFSKDFLEHISEDKIDAVIRESMRVSKRGFHGITFSNHPNSKDDSTHKCLHDLAWWTEKFHSIDPNYPVIIVDKQDLETPVNVPGDTGLVKLNLGSFLDMFHYGWYNIDIEDCNQWASAMGYTFIQHDLRKGLQIDDEKVNIIFASHLIEHFSPSELNAFLKECHRVLVPSGICRFAFPDARLLCEQYIDGSIGKHAYYNVSAERAKTNLEILYGLLLDGHKAIYDAKVFSLILHDIGFKDVKQLDFGDSQSTVIMDETQDMYPDLSCYIECRK